MFAAGVQQSDSVVHHGHAWAGEVAVNLGDSRREGDHRALQGGAQGTMEPPRIPQSASRWGVGGWGGVVREGFL